MTLAQNFTNGIQAIGQRLTSIRWRKPNLVVYHDIGVGDVALEIATGEAVRVLRVIHVPGASRQFEWVAVCKYLDRRVEFLRRIEELECINPRVVGVQ